MRYFLFSILLMLVFFVFLSDSEAETVTVTFTESTVNTGGGDPALAYCTIYKCQGRTCTNWERAKQVKISVPGGGGVRSEDVDVDLASGTLPTSYRLAFSCTTIYGNESPLLIPNSAAGNPFTVEP